MGIVLKNCSDCNKIITDDNITSCECERLYCDECKTEVQGVPSPDDETHFTSCINCRTILNFKNEVVPEYKELEYDEDDGKVYVKLGKHIITFNIEDLMSYEIKLKCLEITLDHNCKNCTDILIHVDNL